MRIALVSPLVEPLPPPHYGGTERIVSMLAEELVRRGHDVTVFASGDSQTSARLVACAPRALRADAEAPDLVTATLFELSEVYRRADEFDVIHNHADWYGFTFANCFDTPTVTTPHGRLDKREIAYSYNRGSDQPLVSISWHQRRSLPGANWVGTVYNGIDVDRLRLRTKPGDYLAFLGRLSPEKRPDRAVEIAERTGMKLVVAAKLDPAERDYYETVVEPLFKRSRLVEYVGEVDERGKDQILGGAYAYLFPIDWPEPFGLTMVESMATGTPVVAMDHGAVREVVSEGETGFICKSTDEMVAALDNVWRIDRNACRRHVETFFSSARMCNDYEDVYANLVYRRPAVLTGSNIADLALRLGDKRAVTSDMQEQYAPGA